MRIQPLFLKIQTAVSLKLTGPNVAANSKRFANVLAGLGLSQSDRVATIAWNNHRHLESWYAISGSGYICHTINPRLFPEQLIFIINDAQDRVVLFDKTFAPLIAAVKAHLPHVEHFICLDAVDDAITEKNCRCKIL